MDIFPFKMFKEILEWIRTTIHFLCLNFHFAKALVGLVWD